MRYPVKESACRPSVMPVANARNARRVIPSRTTKPAVLPTRYRSRTSSPIGRSKNRHAAAALERNLPTTLVNIAGSPLPPHSELPPIYGVSVNAPR